jgi:hypothetical protein
VDPEATGRFAPESGGQLIVPQLRIFLVRIADGRPSHLRRCCLKSRGGIESTRADGRNAKHWHPFDICLQSHWYDSTVGAGMAIWEDLGGYVRR